MPSFKIALASSRVWSVEGSLKEVCPAGVTPEKEEEDVSRLLSCIRKSLDVFFFEHAYPC